MATLPPGQRLLAEMPRFGLPWMVGKTPDVAPLPSIAIEGLLESPRRLTHEVLQALPRTSQVSDFHCVTTWSATGVAWSGVRFADLYEAFIVPECRPAEKARYVVLHGADGYEASVWLEDALAADVLLADTMNDEPLPYAHGKPIRWLAPQQYGFKNVKHLTAIRFSDSASDFTRKGFAFQDHPRARVALEERGKLPAWLLRGFYRLFVRSIIAKARRAVRARG